MQNNLFFGIPASLPDELVETIAGGRGVRIERIVSRGHASPEGFWYDQSSHEFVLVISGHATLAFEKPHRTVSLDPGDYIIIRAHERHRVQHTAPETETVWLAVFFEP